MKPGGGGEQHTSQKVPQAFQAAVSPPGGLGCTQSTQL